MGWLVAAIQEALADAIFDVTLPHWRRIGLVSGCLAACMAAAFFVSAFDAVPSALLIIAPIIVLLVLTVLQMWALRALSRRAWLWALPMPLAGWLLTGGALDPARTIGSGCGVVVIYALYHVAGGLVLEYLARHSTRKHKLAGPPPLEA